MPQELQTSHSRGGTSFDSAVDQIERSVTRPVPQLDALPEDARTAVVLRDVEACSTAEVAETLGLTIANAKTRVHRARLFLRHRLAESLR